MLTIAPQQAGLINCVVRKASRIQLNIGIILAWHLERKSLMAMQDFWPVVGARLGGAPLDLGYAKTRAEVLSLGDACAAAGKPVGTLDVGFRVGGLTKTLRVYGERWWRLDDDDRCYPSAPLPFVRQPLDWRVAFGGENDLRNPLGVGTNARDHLLRGELAPLPRVEDRRTPLQHPNDTPSPAGFGALDVNWQPRAGWAGTYGPEWFEDHFPGLAADVDDRFLQSAPSDQWCDGYLNGTEVVEIRGMHPDKPMQAFELPGLRPRAFIAHGGVDAPLDEIPLVVDTLWLMGTDELVALCYRGVVPVRRGDGGDVMALVVGVEGGDDLPLPPAHYTDLLVQRSDPSRRNPATFDESPLLPAAAQVVAEREALVARTAAQVKAGPSPTAAEYKRAFFANLPEVALDGIVQAIEQGRDFIKEHGWTLRPQEGEEVSNSSRLLRDAITSWAELEPESRREAVRQVVDAAIDAALEEHVGQELLGAIDTAVSLAPLVQQHGPALLPVLEAALSRITELSDAKLVDDVAPEDLLHMSNDDFVAALMPKRAQLDLAMAEQNLSEMAAEMSVGLPQVTIGDSSGLDTEAVAMARRGLEARVFGPPPQALELPQLPPGFVDHDEPLGVVDKDVLARLELNFTMTPDGTLDLGALVSETARVAAEAEALAASLGEPPPVPKALRAEFGQMILTAAASGHDLSGRHLSDADLRNGALKGAKLRGAKLQRVDLSGADLSGADLAGADLGQAVLEGAVLEGADLSGADLLFAQMAGCRAADAVLAKANLVKVRAVGIDLTGADLTEGTFVEADLARATLSNAVFDRTSFLKCRLHGAQLDGTRGTNAQFADTDLTEAVASNAVWPNATVLSTRMPEVQAKNADLSGCTLADVDATRGDFSGARLSGWNANGSCVFTGATFDGAEAAASGWRTAKLEGASFEGVNLRAADFGDAKLSGAKLTSAMAAEANFHGADLTDVDARRVSFFRAKFGCSTLVRADFREAVLFEAEALDAVLEDTRVLGADLTRMLLPRGVDAPG